MTQRRALPTEFRFLSPPDSDQLHGQHLPSQPSAFMVKMHERRPELFVADDLVFSAHAPQPTHDAPAPAAPQATVIVGPAMQDDFSVGFGGIAAPPSHDFPI